MTQYEDIGFVDIKKNVRLVRSFEDGNVYVKKYISPYQRDIYETLRHTPSCGIPRIVDIYPEYDYFVLIEEYVKGKTLQQMLDEGFIFSPNFVEELVQFLCKALFPIHKMGIVHRDITPANIIYAGGYKFYLVDFGNARKHKTNQSNDTEYIGTQNYAAPEQFGFGQSDKRTDIYSIGVLMNVLLTGGKFIYEQPYRGKLAGVIKRCASVSPRKRYKNISRLRLKIFLVKHNITSNIFTTFIYTYGFLCTMIVSFALWLILFSIPSVEYTNNLAEPIATSSAYIRSERKWDIARDLIADCRFNDAQKALDAISEKLDDPSGEEYAKLYVLYSQNYAAQNLYDDAAKSVIYYVDNINPHVSKKMHGTDCLVYERLKYLYQYCSDSVQTEIDRAFRSLTE